MSKKFSKHIDLAHNYWSSLLKKGDCVIDATCGNGFDLLFLAKLILNEKQGYLFAIDIQKEAISSSKQLLENHLSPPLLSRVCFKQCSHTQFFQIEHPIKLIVYNLGYLPKGNKEVTTTVDSTLLSINNALQLLCDGGAISITCYPGHSEGAKEEKALLQLLAKLPINIWEVRYHKWINGKEAPSLFWIEKRVY